MKHDFKQLEIDRARIGVSVQAAKDLVSSWLDGSSDESDNGKDEPRLAALGSASAGLGYAVSTQPVARPSQALERLRRTTPAVSERKFPPAKPAPPPEADSESESEQESRTTMKRKVFVRPVDPKSKKRKRR